ncbi:class I SAM-dependent methyltransferase [Candidatus Peregrinibacteria bacterium]|nr:class I SAM-dependent methyltransferase [Candidatus Peregrinibacteria bacterium]
MKYKNIYNQLIFSSEGRKGDAIKKREALYIYNFLKNKNIKNTLEVGFADGFSAAHIMAATNGIHYAIDPFQKDIYSDSGLKNIKKLGLLHRLKFENKCSEIILPKLVEKGMKMDFIFIDGDHKFDSIFIDFFYADKLINIGGYILFHDVCMESTQHVISWIYNNKNYKIKVMLELNLVLVKKLRDDNRKWDHFVKFRPYPTFKKNYRLRILKCLTSKFRKLILIIRKNWKG